MTLMMRSLSRLRILSGIAALGAVGLLPDPMVAQAPPRAQTAGPYLTGGLHLEPSYPYAFSESACGDGAGFGVTLGVGVRVIRHLSIEAVGSVSSEIDTGCTVEPVTGPHGPADRPDASDPLTQMTSIAVVDLLPGEPASPVLFGGGSWLWSQKTLAGVAGVGLRLWAGPLVLRLDWERTRVPVDEIEWYAPNGRVYYSRVRLSVQWAL